MLRSGLSNLARASRLPVVHHKNVPIACRITASYEVWIAWVKT